MSATRRAYCLVRTEEPTKEQIQDQYSRQHMFGHLEQFCIKQGHPWVGSGGLKDYVARLDIEHEQAEPSCLFDKAKRLGRLNPRNRKRTLSDKTRQRYDRLLLQAGHFEIIRRDVYRWHRKPMIRLAREDNCVLSKKANLRSESPIDSFKSKSGFAEPINGCAAGRSASLFQEQKKQIQHGPERAALRHGVRDSQGRYAPLVFGVNAKEIIPPRPLTDDEIDQIEREWTQPQKPAGEPQPMPSAPMPPAAPQRAVTDNTKGLQPISQAAAAVLALVEQARAAQQRDDAERRAAGQLTRGELFDKQQARHPQRAPSLPKAAPARAPDQPKRKPTFVPQADDKVRADYVWLHLSLGGIAALHGLNHTWAAKQGFTRGHWRQGVAALIAQQPGRVGDAKAYVIDAARRAAKQESPDCRLASDYVPLVTWGGAALRFIGSVE